jgi:hypothetical protein
MENYKKLPEWLQKLWEVDASLARDAEKDINKLNEAVNLIKYFVKRVDEGSVRSVTTYSKYEKFLDSLNDE